MVETRQNQVGQQTIPSRRRSVVAALFLFLLATPRGTGADTNAVVLPYQLRQGHIMVPAAVQGLSNTLSLMLDTGYGMTMLHPARARDAGLARAGRGVTIIGIAGEERADTYDGPVFDFLGRTWKPRRIAALSDDGAGRGRRRDGILGSGFFRRFVVRLQPARRTVELIEPDAFEYAGDGEILPLDFRSSTPNVEATLRFADGRETKVTLEIDTGCDSALCIGQHFVREHGLGDVAGNEGGRFGVGGTRRVKESRFAELRLGKTSISKPRANLFLEGSPSDPPLAGHIGWDLLDPFRVTFDYPRRRMILERVK